MYSSAFEATLNDGTRCRVRPCCHTLDREEQATLREGIRAAWCALSPESRYARFGMATRQLDERQLDYLSRFDNADRFAWCAFIGEEGEHTGIGLARYVRLVDEPGVAEFAVTVIDAYQHRGLGGILLARLVESAREAGLEMLRGYVGRGNRAMLALARKLGASVVAENQGFRADIPLTGQDLPGGMAAAAPRDHG
jgi:L-amino acid N-acyltransferase YncA